MKSQILLLGTAIAALLACGCGDDRPDSGPPPGSGYAASPAAPAPAAETPDPLRPGDSGTLSTADPLLSSSDSASSGGSRDLLAQPDPLKGRGMPTDHSHWLKGWVRDARLTVRLNGLPIGEYTGLVDKDITMKLRRGINSVSFTYAPLRAGGSARMNLLESEHHPPIAPLAAFQSPAPSPGAEAETTPAQAATQSFTFYAR